MIKLASLLMIHVAAVQNSVLPIQPSFTVSWSPGTNQSNARITNYQVNIVYDLTQRVVGVTNTVNTNIIILKDFPRKFIFVRPQNELGQLSQ